MNEVSEPAELTDGTQAASLAVAARGRGQSRWSGTPSAGGIGLIGGAPDSSGRTGPAVRAAGSEFLW